MVYWELDDQVTACSFSPSDFRVEGLATTPNLLQVLQVLGGSWDLVSKVISPLIGVISIVTLLITLVTNSHDPPSRAFLG